MSLTLALASDKKSPSGAVGIGVENESLLRGMDYIPSVSHFAENSNLGFLFQLFFF